MNALELLKNDHDKINELFEQLEEAQDYDRKRDVYESIKEALVTHARIEKTVFYPAFAGRPGFEDLIEEAFEEYEEMKDLLDEVDSEDNESEMDNLLDDLQEAVDQHVDKEENELFPKILEAMNDHELTQLGRQLEAAKQGSAQAA